MKIVYDIEFCLPENNTYCVHKFNYLGDVIPPDHVCQLKYKKSGYCEVINFTENTAIMRRINV